MTAWDGNY